MIILSILGWCWALPVTLVGLLVVAFCRPRGVRIRWRGYHGTILVVEVTLGRWLSGYGAGTFGAIQGYLGPADERRRRHEDTHTLQGFILGPLNVVYFLIAAGLFLWHLARTRDLSIAVAHAYFGNPLEIWAYRWESRS